MERVAWSAPTRDRRDTGVRRRATALETALHLGASAAHVVALDAVSDAVLIVDRGGIIVYTNPACDALLDHREGDLVGRRVLSLVLERGDVLRPMLHTLRHEYSWRGRVVVRQARGGLVPVDLTITPATQVEPAPSHFCITARRADEGARARVSLLDVVGRLASETAHEFNNQISVILNYTFILLRQLPESSPLRDHLPQMQAAAWRASMVAQELLAFGSPRVADPDLLSLNAVIANLETLLGHTLQGTTELESHPALDLMLVRARLPQIEWLLVELALHARRVLGSVDRFVVETWNEEVPNGDGTVAYFVVMQVRATSDRSPLGARNVDAWNTSIGPRTLPSDAAQLPGVELALTHTQGALTTTRDDDASAITYRLSLPVAIS